MTERTITISDEEFEKGQNESAKRYLQAVMDLCYLRGQDELNYVKKTIEMPDGGIYLLQLQHVAGPKIDLQTLYAADKEKATEDGT